MHVHQETKTAKNENIRYDKENLISNTNTVKGKTIADNYYKFTW